MTATWRGGFIISLRLGRLCALAAGCAAGRSQLGTRAARNPAAAYPCGHVAATWRGVITSARQITYGTRLLPL